MSIIESPQKFNRLPEPTIERSQSKCQFIFRFSYVEPFGHDNSPNEGTVTFWA